MTSCLDQDYDFSNISNEIEISPEVAVPLAFGSLSLDNLLNELDSNEIVKQFPDSLLYIFYSDSLFSYNASDVIDIPDQDFVQFALEPVIPAAFVLPGIGDTISEIVLPPLLGGETIPLTFDQDLEFSFENNERLDSIALKSLAMHINISSNFQNRLLLNFHTPSIVVDGIPFSELVEVSNGTASFDKIMNNVFMKLDTSALGTTILGLKIDLLIINEGAAIRPGDNCVITMSFRDMEFETVYGYLGEYDILTNEGSIDVSFFSKKILGGSLSLANPQLNLFIKNSFGVPISLGLDMEVVSTIKNPPTPPTSIEFNDGLNSFNIRAPGIDSVDIQVPSEILISGENSNFVTAMETSPDILNYSATATINKNGTKANSNFVTENSMVDVGVEVTLPIEIKARGFTFEDTINFDFEDRFGDNLDRIEYFRLTMGVTNEIPLEMKLQLYFTDSLYNVLDSLFRDDDVLLNPAPLASDGIHTTAESKVNQIVYEAEQLQKLKTAKYARIKATVNTPIPIPPSTKEYFRFYSFYKLGFELGATVRAHINTNEF